jgi:N-acetylglutamate synthase-like GNAT family acetyltransferase
MRRWTALVGQGSVGARTIIRDGVVAAVVPAAPERAVVNSVTYEHPAALAAAYDELEASYSRIGAAWTVWVHPGDAEAAALLEARGHLLDATPEAMARRLDEPLERLALADFTSRGSVADAMRINDRAYQFGTDSFSRSLTRLPEGAARIYVARLDGTPVACCMTIDDATNSEIQMVAVVPEARGRGLSRKLLSHALADAAGRGIETSTLVATRAGRPMYERLGFRPLGALQMWERRVSEG